MIIGAIENLLATALSGLKAQPPAEVDDTAEVHSFEMELDLGAEPVPASPLPEEVASEPDEDAEAIRIDGSEPDTQVAVAMQVPSPVVALSGLVPIATASPTPDPEALPADRAPSLQGEVTSDGGVPISGLPLHRGTPDLASPPVQSGDGSLSGTDAAQLQVAAVPSPPTPMAGSEAGSFTRPLQGLPPMSGAQTTPVPQAASAPTAAIQSAPSRQDLSRSPEFATRPEVAAAHMTPGALPLRPAPATSERRGGDVALAPAASRPATAEAAPSAPEVAAAATQPRAYPRPVPASPAVAASAPAQVTDPSAAMPATDPGLAAGITVHLPRDRRAEGAVQPAGLTLAHPLAEPRRIIRQVAERAADAKQNQIEITLSPEELGKVRLVITPGDNPVVTVHAENRDVLDLMRRNGELLARELRDTGLGGASISFGDGGADNPQWQRPERSPFAQARLSVEEGESAAEKSVAPRAVAGRQIDIRI